MAPPARSKQMKGTPDIAAAAAGPLHGSAASSACMSVDSAFALPDLSTAANHAGAMTIAGALSNPAATNSRRVTGRLWFSCRIGSPRAWGRAGFLRMNMWVLSLFPLLQSHRGAGEHGRAGRLGSLGNGCSAAQSWNSREQRVELVARGGRRGGVDVGTDRVRNQRIDDDAAVGRVRRGRAEERRRGRGDAGVESGSEKCITQRLCIDQLSAVCRGQLRDGRLLGWQERGDLRRGGQRLLLRVV